MSPPPRALTDDCRSEGSASPCTAEFIVLINLGLLWALSLFGNLVVPRPQVDKWGAPYLIWVGAMAAAPVLQIFISLPRFAGIRARYGRWIFALDLLLAYGPVLSPLRLQASAGFPMASTLILFTGRTRWLLLAAQITAVAAIDVYFWPVNSLGKESGQSLFWLVDAVSTGVEVYAVTRFAQVVTSLSATRKAVARTSLAVERLRAGRDIHDLLGFSLTAITLKLEVAIRSLSRQRDTTEQIKEVQVLTGRAVADLRTVAAGEPLTSLVAEAGSARSVLAWAGIEAQITIDAGTLAPKADAALALVLREAVTNLLRHSSATRCVIRAGPGAGRTLRLEVSNDGACPAGAEPGGGSGLGNLSARLTPLEGRIDTRYEDGWFHLTAVVAAGAQREYVRRPSKGTVLALTTIGLIFLMSCLNPALLTLDSARLRFGGMATVLASLLLMIHLCRPRPAGARPALRWPAFAALVLIGVVPFLYDWSPVAMLQTAGAVVIVIFRGRGAWALFTLTAVVDAYLGSGLNEGEPAGPLPIGLFVAYVLQAVYFQVMFYAVFRMAGLVDELTEARAELARVTVTRERLRFGRDLRDRLGSGLFSITRSLARARALPADRGEEAAAELTEALRMARRTSGDVREIAHGRTGQAGLAGQAEEGAQDERDGHEFLILT